MKERKICQDLEIKVKQKKKKDPRVTRRRKKIVFILRRFKCVTLSYDVYVKCFNLGKQKAKKKNRMTTGARDTRERKRVTDNAEDLKSRDTQKFLKRSTFAHEAFFLFKKVENYRFP